MSPILSRRNLLIGLLSVVVLLLSIEIVLLLPHVLQVWHPYDYWQYGQMGDAVRQGRNPFGPGRFYPLPTVIWLFVPLSLLPDWFQVIWVVAPFAFILILFRRQAFPLFGFVPLWFVVGDGMLDGWLLLPLAWLLENRRGWAGFGAAILLFKPQLAILTVMFAVVCWLVRRDWRNLGAFATAMTIFYVPSFIVNPNWIAQMLAVLPNRTAQTTTLLPAMTGSVWAWKELGLLGVLIVGMVLTVTLVLARRAWRAPEKHAAICQLFGLILNPILFGSSFVAAIPTLRGQKQILIVVLLSWLAFGLDKAIGNFGGGYVLVPLAALYFQTGTQE